MKEDGRSLSLCRQMKLAARPCLASWRMAGIVPLANDDLEGVCVCVCNSYAEEAHKGLPLSRLGHVRLSTFCDG